MDIIRRKMTPAEMSEKENSEAASVRMKSVIDYNIMMENIEDPEAEEGEEDE